MPETYLSRTRSYIEFLCSDSGSRTDFVKPEFFSVDAEFCLIEYFLAIKFFFFLAADDNLIA